MKLIGNIKRLETGEIVLKPTRLIDFKYDPEKEYSVEINPLSNRRTIQQNRYLWALISEICMTEDGNLSKLNATYCRLLEMANAKSIMIQVSPKAFYDLMKIYKHITIKGRHGEDLVCQVFYGSSQLDTKEMAQLIDTTINYASQINCPNIHYYEEMLERNANL